MRACCPLPCGRGKCLIHADTEPTEEECRLLGRQRLEAGLRLACHARARDGLVVTVPHAGTLEVLTQFADMRYEHAPLVRRVPLAVPEANLEEQRSDMQRLLTAVQAAGHELALDELAALPAQLRSGQPLHALLYGDRLLGVRPQGASHALIVDIGTTTVAALLANLDEGRILAARGERNAQSPYGADIISRIHGEMEWESAGRQATIPSRQPSAARSTPCCTSC